MNQTTQKIQDYIQSAKEQTKEEPKLISYFQGKSFGMIDAYWDSGKITGDEYISLNHQILEQLF